MDILAQGARELGLALTPHQLDQFEVYYRELADWNQRINLTAIVQYQEVQVRHFLDSLTLCLALPDSQTPPARVIDVGAGAGFPGIPLKLTFPDLHLVLVDSVGKKTTFLRHLTETLALSGVEMYTGRAEELGHQSCLRESFDLVVSRGVAKMRVLLEYTLPLCRLGGMVVALKHEDIQQELADAAHALDTLGGRLAEVRPVEVSGLTDRRVVVQVEKVKATPAKFPRRPGLPAKHPL